jgi:hypothetical protein
MADPYIVIDYKAVAKQLEEENARLKQAVARKERFAAFFEQMMLTDMSAEYSDHTMSMLNDPRYDKTYLCVILERAALNGNEHL